MTIYSTHYLSKAKKFEVRVEPGKMQGETAIVIDSYDKLSIVLTEDQKHQLMRALGASPAPSPSGRRPVPQDDDNL